MMNRHQERMEAAIHSLRLWRKEATEACLESKEPTSVEIAQLEYPEIPKKEATVKSFGALKKWHGNRHIAVGRLEGPKEWTQGKVGSQKKLAAAAAGRGVTRRAGMAPRKGRCR
jgi:hypothetical protein